MVTIKIKRAKRAQLNSAVSAGKLVQGEPYLITDEDKLAVGLSTTTYKAYVTDDDSRLSDDRDPNAHTHGSITDDGKVGSTADLPLKTGTGGVVEAGAFGSSAGQFVEGNDSRLSDSREWTADTVSQEDAEAGTATDRKAWTAQRVKQAIEALGGGGGGDSTKLAGINAQTGTTYTFVIGDAGKRVRCTNENAITVTVPQNSSVEYDIGTVIEVEQGGAGVVTLDEDTSVTINGALKTWGQYSAVRLLKLDTNLWTVDGGSE